MQVLVHYIQQIQKQFATGSATEHSYRGILQSTLTSLADNPGIQITNEPKRIDVGAPDYSITNSKNLIIGYIEAKDIGEPLAGKKHQKQFDRYKDALSNLIITDYLQFDFYQDGQLTESVRLAEQVGNKITVNQADFQKFVDLWKNFIQTLPLRIDNPQKLAEMMAPKTRLVRQVIQQSLENDIAEKAEKAEKHQEETPQSELYAQFASFKKLLIHDIAPEQFADIYAQTIAYGMFSARIHDTTLDDFSRQEAGSLIPKSNPFLRKLFNYIAGVDLDVRLTWVVDDLVQIFRATDIATILKDFQSKQQDPIVHFYETFLSAYNPQLRKSRGIWYTPQAVVDFIVRGVDEILQKEYKLAAGLSDSSKTEITVPQQGTKETTQKTVHRVQILDPATGTGTFLAAVINHIHQQYFATQQGIWESYVTDSLLPRLNGFELLMAPYAMAHIKLDLVLKQTGAKLATDKRLNVFLTNALEEAHQYTGTLFAQWLGAEATAANKIKRDTPVMVVMGNPPYSGESQNKGDWIMQLMEDYKKEPGGKQKLQERNPKWINDDYMKFIRMSQHYIERNKQSIVAFINPHGFLDNPTFRGVRWHLMKTFDKIYCIDLHGNSKKKESAPDGGKDENVFDIQQGVSINFFVKTGKKKADELAQVYHYDLYGERQAKYDFLNSNALADIPFTELPNKAPMYLMVPRDFALEDEYNKGFSVDALFTLNSVGIVTARDGFTIHNDKEKVTSTIKTFLDLDDEEARSVFNLGKDVRDWQVRYARKDLEHSEGKVTEIAYRPFDTRYTYYTGKSKGFHCYPRNDTMRHFLAGENVGLSFHKREELNTDWAHIFISSFITEHGFTSSKTTNYQAPLYLYPSADQLQLAQNDNTRKPNLNQEIVDAIAKDLQLSFMPEESDDASSFAPIDILDYIYAVLHSPDYRHKYNEFLKSDFPRVPYPKDKQTFKKLVETGGQLRALHLMEEQPATPLITEYPIAGDNTVTRSARYTNKQVWINDTQYFGKVPKIAWEFYIGGYQPAQKWLKDRKGTTLKSQEVLHYQRIIATLAKTHKLMQGIKLPTSTSEE